MQIPPIQQGQAHQGQETPTVLAKTVIVTERLVVLQVEACRHLSEPKSEMKRVRL